MNEDKSPKVCPLLQQHCLESSCAWYMQGCRLCALLVMGKAGKIATTTAIIGPGGMGPAGAARGGAAAAGEAAAAGKPIS